MHHIGYGRAVVVAEAGIQCLVVLTDGCPSL